MNKYIALATALGTGFASIAYAQVGPSGIEIQKSLKGKRVAFACIDGSSGTGRYTMRRNSGTLLGSYGKAGQMPIADAAQVRAQGTSLCLRFRTLNNGEERCFDVSQTGPRSYNFSLAGISACTLSVL